MEVTEKHGVVRIVPVRVNSNLNSRTLDQIIASKKQTHMAAFQFALQELHRDLSHTWHEEGLWRLESKGANCSTVDVILDECKQVLERHKQVNLLVMRHSVSW
jgi:hypothetical protein